LVTFQDRVNWQSCSRASSPNCRRVACVIMTHLLLIACLAAFIRLLADVIAVDYQVPIRG
jgi:hypothetical protein